jgi:hypothetical protein
VKTSPEVLAGLPERIRSKIAVTAKCWEWTGHRNVKDGYAVVRWKGQARHAARVIYEILVGPIPKAMEPDHLCRNRGCVNPNCIEIVTHKVNTLRGNTLGAVNARKTQCPRGHSYTEANTLIENGHRRCRICRSAQLKIYKQTYRRKYAEN